MPQDAETPLQRLRNRFFVCRYAYSRSADARQAGDPGEDFLTFAHDRRAFVFALCDGVSQSFYGGRAASFLGQGLCQWLRAGPAPMEETADALVGLLHGLTGAASEETRARLLPENIPALVRDVLEQKRAHGGETTFVCGRLDLPGRGLPRGRIMLAWMGDTRLRLWTSGRRPTTCLSAGAVTAQRWSTRVGPVGGAPGLYQSDVLSVSRIVAYTDGLQVLDKCGAIMSDDALRLSLSTAEAGPVSDDVAFLEIQFPIRQNRLSRRTKR